MKDQREDKDKIVELLKTTPIVGAACARTGIARATFYRWLKEDPEFAKRIRGSLRIGNHDINDLAFSKLINHIKAGSMPAITFHLSRRHPYYKRRENMKYKVQIEGKRGQPIVIGEIPEEAFSEVIIGKLVKRLRKRVVKQGMKMRDALQATFDEITKEHPDFPKKMATRRIPWDAILKAILERREK